MKELRELAKVGIERTQNTISVVEVELEMRQFGARNYLQRLRQNRFQPAVSNLATNDLEDVLKGVAIVGVVILLFRHFTTRSKGKIN